jgi:hypothetical protein
MKDARPALIARKEIASFLPDGFRVKHVAPRAYCLAKPAPECAVFALPEFDTQAGRLSGNRAEVVHKHHGGPSVADVALGDWATLVYASDGHCGTWFAVPPMRITGASAR